MGYLNKILVLLKWRKQGNFGWVSNQKDLSSPLLTQPTSKYIPFVVPTLGEKCSHLHKKCPPLPEGAIAQSLINKYTKSILRVSGLLFLTFSIMVCGLGAKNKFLLLAYLMQTMTNSLLSCSPPKSTPILKWRQQETTVTGPWNNVLLGKSSKDFLSWQWRGIHGHPVIRHQFYSQELSFFSLLQQRCCSLIPVSYSSWGHSQVTFSAFLILSDSCVTEFQRIEYKWKCHASLPAWARNTTSMYACMFFISSFQLTALEKPDKINLKDCI